MNPNTPTPQHPNTPTPIRKWFSFNKRLVLLKMFCLIVSLHEAQVPFGFNFNCGVDYPFEADSGAIYSRGINTICSDTSMTKYIGIHYHFILDDHGNGNFRETNDGNGNSNYNGYLRAEDVINNSNWALENIAKMWRLQGNTTPIPDLKVRFFLLSVTFHRSTYYQQSNYKNTSFQNEVISNLGKDIGHVINYFEVNNGVGSGIANLVSNTSSPPSSLFAFANTYIEYTNYPEWTSYPSQLFNHEIGHLLGLYHTWLVSQNDGCIDTPPGVGNQQCWAFNANHPYCGDWANISNNLMDYNQYHPHAITPCQVDRIDIRLNSTLNQFIHSCEGCAPPSSIFYARDSMCRSLIWVHSSASMNETKHKYEVCEVSSYYSDQCLSTPLSTGWISGSAGSVNLSSNPNLNFQKNKFYKITLTTSTDECVIDDHSSYQIIRTLDQDPPCLEAPIHPEIKTLYPNPTFGILNIEFRLFTSGTIRIDLLDTQSNFVMNLSPSTSMPEGTFVINSDLSSIQQGGLYYVTLFQDNIPVTATVIRL